MFIVTKLEVRTIVGFVFVQFQS